LPPKALTAEALLVTINPYGLLFEQASSSTPCRCKQRHFALADDT